MNAEREKRKPRPRVELVFLGNIPAEEAELALEAATRVEKPLTVLGPGKISIETLDLDEPTSIRKGDLGLLSGVVIPRSTGGTIEYRKSILIDRFWNAFWQIKQEQVEKEAK